MRRNPRGSLGSHLAKRHLRGPANLRALRRNYGRGAGTQLEGCHLRDAEDLYAVWENRGDRAGALNLKISATHRLSRWFFCPEDGTKNPGTRECVPGCVPDPCGASDAEILLGLEQGLFSGQQRHVLQTDVAIVTELVDLLEEERIVGFSALRLVPAGDRRHVEVPDVLDVEAQEVGDVAGHDAHVVDVVKHLHVGASRFLADRDGKEVASKCDISSSMLSQIEKGNANPSLNTIKAIAQALEVPLFTFFINSEETKYTFHIVKKEERKRISTENVIYELLTPKVESKIEFMQMTLRKNAETSVRPMSHKGEEVAVLLEGKVELIIGNSSITLSPGDSVHIPAMAPHKWKNLQQEKSIVLFSVTPPEF